jgi:hypothetical protein
VFISLWDLFGDTWNGAQFHLERPDGNTATYSLIPDQSPYNVYLHDLSDNRTAHEGLYYMTVQTPDESIPAEWWEVSEINHDNNHEYICYFIFIFIFADIVDCQVSWST